MNLAENLIKTAGVVADTTAIKLDDFELTYAALDEASAASVAGGRTRASGSTRTP
jgi:hypothetical protein